MIIPALNEEETVGKVVAQAKLDPVVTEVIVVDDKSLDRTVEEAKKAGATVITSTRLGKGASMFDGALCARNPLLVYLDADIMTYPDDVVSRLAGPLIDGRADFCKSCFSRQAGRVTELVAKPLLSILHPEIPALKQPLSGMIAGRKEFFEKIEFEEGYGVDIGILLDMHDMGARIAEVDIGHIENRMQSLDQLARMSREVANVILKKAKGQDKKNYEMLEYIQVIREQMEFSIRDSARSLKRLAIFDMDNTLLRGSFIQTFAGIFGLKDQLLDIVTSNANPFIRTKQIARMLNGKRIDEILEVVDGIPLTDGIQEILQLLKANGFMVGIMSDSYDCVTGHLKNRFGFDFTIANELEFNKSIATGEVKIPSYFLPHPDSQCVHEFCKTHSLTHVCKRLGVSMADTLAIGDGENDICMVKRAGIGVAFCSSNSVLKSVADHVIDSPDFRLLESLVD